MPNSNLLDLIDELMQLPENERTRRMSNSGLPPAERERVWRWLKQERTDDAGVLDCPPVLIGRLQRLFSGTPVKGHLATRPAGVSDAVFTADARPDEVMAMIEGIEAAAPTPEIAGYEVQRLIACGGMSTVWRARQHSTGRAVALKVMSPWLFASRTARARFGRELRLACRLQHPHIARVYDGGMSGGICYYAMELLEAEHLDRFVQHRGLGRRDILRLMRKVCQAVQYAHQKGIIHRDLKPSNILVDADGEPHVLDLGLARALEETADERLTITVEGGLAGTLAFMSPEQAGGGPGLLLDVRTDVYSLGATLHLLVTGRTPHDVRGNRYVVLRRITEQDVTAPRRLDPRIDRELEVLLLKSLARNPDRRYASADEFGQDIENYLRGEPLKARPPRALYLLRKRLWKHRLPLALTTALLAAALGSFYYAYRNISGARDGERLSRIEAQRGLADSWVAAGNAHVAAGQWVEATDRYAAASDLYSRLRLSRMRGDLGLSQAYQYARPPLLELVGHEGEVRCVAMSPDGRLVASGGEDCTLRLWDLPSGRSREIIWRSNRPIETIAFSSDATKLVAGDSFGRVRVWETHTGTMLKEFIHLDSDRQPPFDSRKRRDRTALAFSTDGQYLAMSSPTDHKTHVWDVRLGSEMWQRDDVTPCIAFSRHGHALWSGGETATRWTFDPSGCFRTRNLGGNGKSIAVSVDESIIANTISNGVSLCRPLDGSIVTCGGSGYLPSSDVAFSADGHHFFFFSDVCGRLCTWTLPEDDKPAAGLIEVAVPDTERRGAWSTGLAWDHAVAATAGRDGVVRMWDLSTEGEVQLFYSEFSHWPERYHDIAASADGRLVAACSSTLGLVVWDRATGRPLISYPDGRGRVTFSPDGYRLAFNVGELLCVADLADPANVRRLGYHDDPLTALHFYPNGRRLLSSAGPSLRAWDLERSARLWHVQTPTVLTDTISVSRDGRRALAASTHGFPVIYDADTGRLLPGIDDDAPNPGVRGLGSMVGFLADGATAVTNNHPLGGFGLYDLLPLRPGRRLAGAHTDLATQFAVSPDDQWALAGGAEGVVTIWDLAAGEQVRAFSDTGTTHIAFSPDGTLILSAGTDGYLRVRDLTRPQKYRELLPRIGAARSALQANPNNSAAWATLGEWYAFRGRWEWAAEALKHAATGGHSVSPLLLGQCLWRDGDTDGARREFGRALKMREAPEPYLRLCLNAINAAPSLAVENAHMMACRGDYLAAAREYDQRIFDGTLSQDVIFAGAVLHAYLGEEVAYREICRRMVGRFGTSEWSDEVGTTARACLLLPQAFEESQSLRTLVARALEKSNDPRYTWEPAGLLHLRCGEPDAAIEYFKKALDAGATFWQQPQLRLLEAIAHYYAGRTAEAREALDAAERTIALGFPWKDPTTGHQEWEWTDWLVTQMLRREARALILRERPVTRPVAAPISAQGR